MQCYSCEVLDGKRKISPGVVIFEGKYWRIDHAYPTALIGWLVLILKRHAEALHELHPEEYNELTTLLQKTTKLLHKQLQTRKEYVACFAEAENFQHLHIHVIPRSDNLPKDLKGPAIFAMLKTDKKNLPEETVRELCFDLKNNFS